MRVAGWRFATRSTSRVRNEIASRRIERIGRSNENPTLPTFRGAELGDPPLSPLSSALRARIDADEDYLEVLDRRASCVRTLLVVKRLDLFS